MLLKKAIRTGLCAVLASTLGFAPHGFAKTSKRSKLSKKDRARVQAMVQWDLYRNRQSRMRNEQILNHELNRFRAKMLARLMLQKKTVREFVEKGPKKFRTQRRTFLGQSFSQKMPIPFVEGTTVHLFRPDVSGESVSLQFYTKSKNKPGLKLNGKDITKKKNESLSRWMRRVSRLFPGAKSKAKRRRKRKSAWLNFIFEQVLPTASAAPSRYPGYQVALLEAYRLLAETEKLRDGIRDVPKDKVEEFLAQFGLYSDDGDSENDILNYETYKDILKDFKVPDSEQKYCATFPRTGEGKDDALQAGLANLPIPPSIRKTLGKDSSSMISVYPETPDSQNIVDIIFHDKPIRSDHGLYISGDNVVADPANRPKGETFEVEVRDSSGEVQHKAKIHSRTRIDYGKDPAEFTYPMSSNEAARNGGCRANLRYVFDRGLFPDDEEFDPHCKLPDYVNDYKDARVHYDLCNQISKMEFPDESLLLFTPDGSRLSCKEDTKSCLHHILLQTEISEDAKNVVLYPSEEISPEVQDRKTKFIEARRSHWEPLVARAYIITEARPFNPNLMEADQYQVRKSRGRPLYMQTLGYLQDTDPEAFAREKENWLNSMINEEWVIENGGVKDASKNEQRFVEEKRRLLLIFARSLDHYSDGKFGEGGSGLQVREKREVSDLMGRLRTYLGEKATGNFTLATFCQPNTEDCEEDIRTYLDENLYNDQDDNKLGSVEHDIEEAYEALSSTEVPSSHNRCINEKPPSSEKPGTHKKTVGELFEQAKENLQDARDKGGKGSTLEMDQLASYVNVMTALCRAQSFVEGNHIYLAPAGYQSHPEAK